MTDTLTIILDNAAAGTVSRLGGGRLRFDYDDSYRAIPSATPLSVSMPKPVRTNSDGVINPWLWGLLPDNEAVLARWARDFHTSASPFALLSTPIGHDCAGAVRFAQSDEVDDLIAQPGEVTWLSEHDVAQRLRELQEDSTSWLGRDFSGQFSLAAMIDDYAPNIANLPIATDDPLARVADEMVKAASRYVDADPKSIYGSAQERLRALFRVVGLAGRGLSI
jgi:HipA-like protein